MNRKLGLSSCSKKVEFSLFKSCAENGIDYLEISPRENEFDNIDWKLLKKYSEETGVTLWSFHLPFFPFDTIDISSTDEEVRTATLARHKKLINAAAQIGIKTFIIHASGEPISDEKRPLRLLQAKKSLKELADFAENLSCVIAVEDLPRSCLGNCSQEILSLTEDPRLAICFDTNHLLGEDISDFIKNTAHRFITTHVSDYDRINERHWLPGEGVINWPKLITLLNESGYTGPLLYEIAFTPPKTLDRPRDLTPADFRRNYEELCANKPLTVLGTPHKNLGMWG